MYLYCFIAVNLKNKLICTVNCFSVLIALFRGAFRIFVSAFQQITDTAIILGTSLSHDIVELIYILSLSFLCTFQISFYGKIFVWNFLSWKIFTIHCTSPPNAVLWKLGPAAEHPLPSQRLKIIYSPKDSLWFKPVHCHEGTLTFPQEQPQIHFHIPSPCSENCQDLCAVTLNRRQRFYTNFMLKSEPWYPLGYLLYLLLLSLEATASPVLAPRTGGVTKWCSLQMGTASHVYTAKPASREHDSVCPSSLSLCIFGKVLLIWEKKPSAPSIIQTSRLSKYERQYWEPVLNHWIHIWSANTHVA